MDEKDLQLLAGLLDQARALPHRDENALDALQKRGQMIVRNIFGDGAKYLDDLRYIRFHSSVSFGGMDESFNDNAWQSGQAEMINLFETMLEEIQLFSAPAVPDGPDEPIRDLSTSKIFLVHGHDTAMKTEAARTLERLELVPVILHEQPNQGRTIIEKISDFSDVGFAVVCMSPDDVGRDGVADSGSDRPRARQNVVLELGFFLGRLGRDRVIVLHSEEPDFEMPSDYSGVLFTPFDPAGRWKFDLVRELSAAGFNVDANRIL